MTACKKLLIAAIAALLMAPSASLAKRTKLRITPRWHGYGFLPGYHPQPALSDWRARSTERRPNEWRYRRVGWGWYGPLQYGYGRPGFYRGQWNGGSFGPCWAQTPLGPLRNCGK